MRTWLATGSVLAVALGGCTDTNDEPRDGGTDAVVTLPDTGPPEADAGDPCADIRCEAGRRCNPETLLCEEVPAACDVVAQDCPGADESCTILEDGSIGCAPTGGSRAEGEACDAGEGCAAGLVCAGAAESGYACMRLCVVEDGSGCSASQCCGPLRGIEGTGVCTDVPPSCDPIAQDCSEGDKCTLVTACGDTGCVPDGERGEGDGCGSAGHDDCAAGLLCIAGECVRFCEGTSDCPDGQTCHSGEGFPAHCMSEH